jgi:hypothetical protein
MENITNIIPLNKKDTFSALDLLLVIDPYFENLFYNMLTIE